METRYVVRAECDEPEGRIERKVSLTSLSMERLKELWDHLSRFDTLFNDYVRGDFRAFVEHFIQQIDGRIMPTGLLWDVDNVGIFFLNEIRPCVSAQAHFVFWDGRFKGREHLCREMCRMAFEEYKFKRIEVHVPLYTPQTLNAVEKIGFIQEGRLRRAIPYKGQWFDVNLYSMIEEDLNHLGGPSKLHSARFNCWGCQKIMSKEKTKAPSLQEA